MRETRSSGLMRGTKDDPWSLLYRNPRQVCIATGSETDACPRRDVDTTRLNWAEVPKLSTRPTSSPEARR